MLVFGLLTLVFFIIFYWLSNDFKFKISKDLTTYGLSLIFALLSSAYLYILTSLLIIDNFAEKILIKNTEKRLYILQNKTEYEGNFFLGCGNFEGNSKYYFLIEDGNGFRLISIPANDVVLIETNEQPKYIDYVAKYKNKFIENNFLSTENIVRREIYIPKYSIKYDFKVNLKN